MAAVTAERIPPARVMQLLVGLWLLLSVFAWPHAGPARANEIAVAVLCLAAALAATRVPAFRWVNTALGVWLFASLWIVPRANVATGYDDAVVALFMVILSFVPPWRPPAEARRASA